MKRFKLNPIARKDLTITSRSMKFTWGLFAFEVMLTIVFLIALGIMQGSRSYAHSNADDFSRFVAMFPAVSIAELCLVALIIPITTSDAIAGEKQRQTFDIMLTTQITPMQIIRGKMMSSIVRIMMYVAASIPIMAVGFTIGGISWWALFFYILLVLVLAILEAAIGCFCSSVCKRSITAILMSYVMLAVVFGCTYLPLLALAILDATDVINVSAGNMMEQALVSGAILTLLPNPVMTFIEFYTHVLAGRSYAIKELTEGCLPGFSVLGEGVIWIILSVAVILLISYLFMRLAAYKTDPLNARGSKKAKKSKS